MINYRGFDSVHHQGGFSMQALPLRSLGFFIPPFAHARMAHGKKKPRSMTWACLVGLSAI